MFGLKKDEITWEQEAASVYAQLLERALSPKFYTDYEVPDTYEGRFDMVLLHVFAAMHVALEDERGEAFNQALFDIFFMDMDQSLREAGKGDMGVSKQMRYMMKAFNGRMNRYHASMDSKNAFKEALKLNLYNDHQVAAKSVKAVSDYVFDMIAQLRDKNAHGLFKGKLKLKAVK